MNKNDWKRPRLNEAVRIFLRGLFCLLFVIAGFIPPNLFADDCAELKITDFPAKDFPSETDRENLIGESAKNFYYGNGVPVDYAKARYAALLELEPGAYQVENGDSQYFSACSILMMIYANGYGVEKNIDLSIRLAQCNLPGTPAEREKRVKHLKKLKSAFFTHVFDVCDDVLPESGYRTICSLDSRVDPAKRDKLPFDIFLENKYKNNETRSREEKRAFEVLIKATGDYFSTRVGNEVDMQGTARASYLSEEEERLESDFLGILAKLEVGIYPAFSALDYRKSNTRLNQVFNRIIKSKDFRNCGSVNPVGIRVVQRRWLAYLEAWVQFGALRFPKLDSESFRTLLTKARQAQLEEFLGCAK